MGWRARRAAGVLLLSTSPPRSTPSLTIFEATTGPVRQHANIVWQQSVSLGLLERGWLELAPLRAESFTWQRAAGPLAVVWLSLLRINWTIGPSLVARDDRGRRFSLLHVDPHRVIGLARAGVQRWQMRNIRPIFVISPRNAS